MIKYPIFKINNTSFLNSIKSIGALFILLTSHAYSSTSGFSLTPTSSSTITFSGSTGGGSNYACSPYDIPTEPEMVIYQIKQESCGTSNYKYYYHTPREEWICNAQPPTGYSITAIANANDSVTSRDCGGGYRYYVKQPKQSGESVCDTGSIPSDFVVKERIFSGSDYTACNNRPVLRILVPSSSYHYICDSSAPIPNTYLVVRNKSTSSDCKSSANDSNGPRLTIRTVESVVSGHHWVCQLNSPNPPSEYSIYDTGSNYNCNGSAYKIRVPEHGDTVCSSPSTLPEGWVAESRDNQGCYTIFDLSELNPGEYLTYCPYGKPKPDGFILTTIQSDSSRCGTTSPLSYTIVAPNGGTYPYCSGQLPAGYAILQSDPTVDCHGAPGYLIGPMRNGSVICEDTSGYSTIPDELQITRVSYEPSCPNNIQLSLTEATGQQLEVCGLQRPLPPNYVITAIRNSDNQVCYGRGGRTIRPPSGSNMYVCYGSPIPSGYVTKEIQLNASQCDGAERYLIGPIQLGENQICEPSPVPEGYVVIARDPNECGNGLARLTITLPNVDETDICFTTTIPNGYIIVGYTESMPACHLSSAYNWEGLVIRQPHNDRPTVSCQGTDLPDGFHIIRETTSSRCPGTAYLIAPNQIAVTPTTFIGSENEVETNNNFNCDTSPSVGGFVQSGSSASSLNCSE